MSMKLTETVDHLSSLAPLSLAEDWDNVGLLVEPTSPRRVHRVLLTIDLTEAVLAEAIKAKAELIVSYHPPIFDPLKRLTAAAWKQRVIAGAIEKRIAIYSPHTALDAVEGGVNDWLADGLGARSVYAVQPYAEQARGQEMKLVVFVPATHADDLREALTATGCAGQIGAYRNCSFNLTGTGTFEGDATTNPAVGRRQQLEHVEEVRLEMVCRDEPCAIQEIERSIREAHPYEEPAWELYALAPKPRERVGPGRDVMLRQPAKLATLVQKVKKHLKLKHVRVAAADVHRTGRAVEHVLLCAGAGGSVLSGKTADVYLTGEMRHHDVLDANANGISVILTEHTNSERGYLPTYKRRIVKALDRKVELLISKRDREPLATM